MENNFDTKIKSFQTDGGGEYTSNVFKNFLALNGISHRLSCPHTPKQNGLVDRKHRHIIVTTLSLMAHSYLPSKYRFDAVSTAVFLINRLPTRVLGNVSPYEKLFRSVLDYNLLRCFGCMCYPYLRPYDSNKLDFCTTKCVFLGYSLNHRGYRCLDPRTGRIYLSCHVVFEEGSYPFMDKNDYMLRP